jgi:tRNA modification GTPase
MLELDVDFTEDISGSPTWLPSIQNDLQNLKKRFKVSQNELPKAVLFGAPNAGKSSLINALAQEDRLLVSETAGTTRDFVEVPLHLPGGDILLIDTAGLASSAQSSIDKQAMQKSKDILEKANLKILAIDISANPPDEFEEWVKFADLIVETHADLHRGRPAPLAAKHTRPPTAIAATISTIPPQNIGIAELRETLNGIFFPKNEETEETWITSERQIACIKKAEECVSKAMDFLKTPEPQIELAAFEMREARNALCSVTGEISDESVLNAIFSSYCIGK